MTDLLTRTDLAALLGISPRTVDSWWERFPQEMEAHCTRLNEPGGTRRRRRYTLEQAAALGERMGHPVG